MPARSTRSIGENGAGKSTLMRVLYGMYPADGGQITVRGKEVKIASPRDAIALGIGMVHQHFVLVDPFTVTENIILGDEGHAILDTADAERRVRELADTYGFHVQPDAVIEEGDPEGLRLARLINSIILPASITHSAMIRSRGPAEKKNPL